MALLEWGRDDEAENFSKSVIRHNEHNLSASAHVALTHLLPQKRHSIAAVDLPHQLRLSIRAALVDHEEDLNINVRLIHQNCESMYLQAVVVWQGMFLGRLVELSWQEGQH